MTELSKYNNSGSVIPIGGSFIGRIESVHSFNAITVNVLISQPSIVTVYQFPTSQGPLSAYSNIFEQSVTEGTKTSFQVPIVSPWFCVVIQNISGSICDLTLNTYLQEQTATCVIDAIQAGGGGYVLPTASESVLGGVKIDGVSITIADGVISATGGGGDASLWANYPAVDNVDMQGNDIINANIISSVADSALDITADGSMNIKAKSNLSLTTATDGTPNIIEYTVLGNLIFYEGEQNIYNLLGVTHSQGFKLTEEGGGSIIFSDNTVQTTAYTGGGGGGNFSTPSTVDLDMDGHRIIGITELTGVEPNGDPIIVNNNIEFAGNPEFGSAAQITNLEYLVGNVDNGLTISNISLISSEPYNNELLLNSAKTTLGGNLKFNQDATEQITAYQNPFQVDLDMNDNGLMNVNGVNGSAGKGQTIVADKTVLISSNQEAVLVSSKTQIILAIPPTIVQFPELPTKTLTYDANGDLTLAEGTQNINNPLGTTTSNSFTLTQDGGGKITFPDMTEMTTASASPSTWSDFPATQAVDMGGWGLSNINGDITTGVNGSLSILSNNNDPVATATLRLIINEESFIENTKPASEIKLDGGEVRIRTVGEGGWDNAPVKTTTFGSDGVFSAPHFKVGETVFDYGLDMNSSAIINAIQIDSAPATNININGIDADSQVVINANNSGIGGTSTLAVAPSGVSLNTLITGTEDTATALFSAQSGTFTAPFFVAQGFQPTGGIFQKGFINTPRINDVEQIFFSDLSGQTTAYTGNDVKTITSTDGSVIITTPSANTVNLSVPTPQGITSNTFYVNDNVNTINDVLPLMGSGDIAIVSAGSFGNTTDITWNKAQTGLSGSVAPIPLTFLTTANASRFIVTASQVRVANIKFQLPVFLSGNSCSVDNCDFDSALTIGTGVTSYITINNCEFAGTQTITVASTFTNVCYFINCNFASSTFSLLNPSASQVIFNNCAGFTSYPANATYVGINVLSAGTAQLSTNDLKSVSGTLRLTSGLNVNSQTFTNVGTMSPPTNQQISFTNGLNIPSGSLNMRFNNIFNAGTITWTTGLTTIASASATRNLYTVSIPAFVSGANANFVMNDLGDFSTKSLTLTTAGQITYPDTTTSNSGLIKGSATLVAGSYTITDARVTTGAICVATYADSSPVGGVLCAKVTAGQIIIESKLITDVSPVFYMYFI